MSEVIKTAKKLLAIPDWKRWDTETRDCMGDLLAELEKAEKVIDAGVVMAMSVARDDDEVIGEKAHWFCEALTNYKGEIKCQICDDDNLHCNYCTKGEDKQMSEFKESCEISTLNMDDAYDVLLDAYNDKKAINITLNSTMKSLLEQLTALQAKCDDYEKVLSAILLYYTMPHYIADISKNVLAKHKEQP